MLSYFCRRILELTDTSWLATKHLPVNCLEEARMRVWSSVHWRRIWLIEWSVRWGRWEADRDRRSLQLAIEESPMSVICGHLEIFRVWRVAEDVLTIVCRELSSIVRLFDISTLTRLAGEFWKKDRIPKGVILGQFLRIRCLRFWVWASKIRNRLS